MGNGVTKVSHCFAINGDISRRHDIAVYIRDPLNHEPLGLGHSFCYIRPEETTSITTTAKTASFFRSISGASVSANTSTPPSGSLVQAESSSSGLDRASTFESSELFASIPLQPVPRGSGALSGPIERGFLSGPIERGFLSGPIERPSYCYYSSSSSSGPVVDKREIILESNNIDNNEKKKKKKKKKKNNNKKLKRSFSHGGGGMEEVAKPKKRGLMKAIKRVMSNKISKSFKGSVKEVVDDSSSSNEVGGGVEEEEGGGGGGGGDGEFSIGGSRDLQWAQGKAGEDRVHIVISEEKGWVFVGIYDGFNGPDAPDYLLSNLYGNVHKELEGLLWDDGGEGKGKTGEEGVSDSVGIEDCDDKRNGLRYRMGKGVERRKMWSFEWDRERVEQLNCRGGCVFDSNKGKVVNHSRILKALSEALRKTEEEYFEAADNMAEENPELALMGSCVLVMLMKGEDVYLMSVGDSRAVLAQKWDIDLGWSTQNLRMIHKERLRDVEVLDDDDDDDEFCTLGNLNSLQLTMDHSTYVDKELDRIKREHPDDTSAIMNDRVKGYLKVTRAFGVGFLKQPKWNDQLLEMFRIDYIGTSPYIICSPSLYHHKLTPRDKYLILSSDGLYQYFTNEEVVAEVESFISSFPEGDPAQHLIEEVLFRAAKKAGMDFHELLDVPQGDRRRYHDDVSVIIISLEGRIWRSSV